ncbi:MAG: GNAT family N-acetyltransferase, partial [Clostridia bacterium]|nr:GNAT family N-acetyltransferase [Clostridia bacterium]
PCWMLNQTYQGKGYAYEAARAYFDYLFNQKGIRRIYAYTEDYNLSSQRLCEKLGMRREGLFVEFVIFVSNTNGTPRYENTMQYAILKKEWDGSVAMEIQNAK